MNRLLFAVFTSAALVGFAHDADALRAKLSRDVKSIAVGKGAYPGCVIADGVHAVPIAFGRASGTVAPMAAASSYGKGRAIAVTHQSFFEGEVIRRAENAAFLRECLGWLADGSKSPAVYIDGGRRNMRPAIESALKGTDREIKVFRGYGELASIPHDSVVVTSPDGHSLSDADKLTGFIRGGGRVLAIVVGWGWHQLNGGKSFSTESPFNAALGPAGMYTGEPIVDDMRDGIYEMAGVEIPAGCTVKGAMDAMAGDAVVGKDFGAQCLFTLGVLAAALPPWEKVWQPRLESLKDSVRDIVPSPAKSLDSSRVRERMSYLLFQREWQRAPERIWPANAAAAVYPGIPEKATGRVTREVPVDLSVPSWHGTGLFAVAGEPLTVTLPEGAEKKGLRIRVGSTTCRLLNAREWRRAPVVDVELPLSKRATTFSSPFGGLVYVVVPRESHGTVNVKIGPACPAPRFVEGRDTQETWAAQLRSCPAPFAEIESKRLVITAPSADMRKLADPRPLLNLWREIMDNDARLTGIPAERKSPERITLDVQLCCGYMHAGYPIMMPLHVARHLLSESTIRSGSPDEVWGFFHEMGHNHQNSDWTFNGTTEVTVNFFSLYNMEKICGRGIRQNDKISGERFQKKIEKWYAAGRPKEQWLADPFLALDFFARLIEKYGWESFEKLFAEYRALPQSERPKNDLEKRRQWCTRLSRIVGEDLSKEFEFLLK